MTVQYIRRYLNTILPSRTLSFNKQWTYWSAWNKKYAGFFNFIVFVHVLNTQTSNRTSATTKNNNVTCIGCPVFIPVYWSQPTQVHLNCLNLQIIQIKQHPMYFTSASHKLDFRYMYASHDSQTVFDYKYIKTYIQKIFYSLDR